MHSKYVMKVLNLDEIENMFKLMKVPRILAGSVDVTTSKSRFPEFLMARQEGYYSSELISAKPAVDPTFFFEIRVPERELESPDLERSVLFRNYFANFQPIFESLHADTAERFGIDER